MKFKQFLQRHGAALLVLVSLCAAFYPFLSNFIFEHRQDSIIDTYEAEVIDTDYTEICEKLEAARQYNRDLVACRVQLTDPFGLADAPSSQLYETLLNRSDNGLMGYIEIPRIGVYLPIYHGTSNDVLLKGVGHLEGSSLPVGGASTHAVLSGHTGLNNTKMFTDLSELENGNVFYIHILGKVFAYEVDQILVVEPDDSSQLQVAKGEDYVSLVTCTPYGVNTHRLLVRGTRVDYVDAVQVEAVQEKEAPVRSQWMGQYRNALVLGIIIVVIALICFHFLRKGR